MQNKEVAKKIIILSDDFPPKSGGGAAVIAYTHATALVKNGYDVLVVTTVEDKKSTGESDENGMRIIRIFSKYPPRFRPYLSLYHPSVLKEVKKIFKKEKPDIVHAHNIHYHLSYHVLKLAKKYSKSLFITIHDSMPFHYSKLFPKSPHELPIVSYRISVLKQMKDFKLRFNPFRNFVIKYYLSLPDKIFSVSMALKKALLDNGIKNIDVIHNGIDVKKWEIDPVNAQDFKSEYNLNNKKIILFCGRLSRAKGGEVLLKILPNITKSVPDALLLIVGEKDRDALNLLKKAEDLKIDHSIVFTGKLTSNRLVSAYRASNLLVTPSLCFDWFPTVNLEAMAVKLPVIATCFGGSSELVMNNETGFIVNPYKESEVTDRIIHILTDDEKAKKFGQSGYERVRKEFSIEKYIQNTISCYNKFS